ncbi:hypothetical protein Tco_0991662 [Tanacetum coccineum]|uniref:Copia protein n=1 Tax=Tanacetum coccineum TaxID=301880 RepID=A0ABQ5EZX0_9ASTR
MAHIASSDTEVKTGSKTCLKNYESLKKQYDDLLVKLSDTDFKAATYKRGLATLEGQIVKYREHEVLFSEEIALLKRSVGSKEYQLRLLRTELEKVKQEKEGFDFKIAKLEDSKPIKTLMSMETKLTRDEEGESVDNTKYRGMIGSLLYLTASRPDIMFSVCLCARFQKDPKISYLEWVKRIFRYIKGTKHLGLWYPKGFDIETIVYADSDHAGDYVDRKSTSGVCTYMGCCLTSWFSKKQTAIAISITEAEYISAGKACQQALWMKKDLIDYVLVSDTPIMCDNKGAIDLSKNPVQHSRTKHIEIRHHFLRDNVQKGNISIEKVSSEDNIADILTKPLKREPFNYLRLGLGMMEQID